MSTLGKTLLALMLAACPLEALAQRFSVGPDGVRWMALGTLNADASVAVSQTVSFHAGAALNPWTLRSGDPDRQFQLRQLALGPAEGGGPGTSIPDGGPAWMPGIWSIMQVASSNGIQRKEMRMVCVCGAVIP